MDLPKLKELIALMAQHDLAEIDIRTGDDFVKLKRGQQAQTVINHQPVMYGGGGAAVAPASGHAMPAALAAAPAAAASAAAPVAAAGTGSGHVHIESPMVGTCYLAPNPDAAPFVKVGQAVTPDTVVCLIEAMKVFNEIKAEKSGVIEQILVKTGQSVEFGQKVFAVRPS